MNDRLTSKRYHSSIVFNFMVGRQGMSNEPLSLEGVDFANFSKENAEEVLLSPSMAVVHQSLGLGTVESIVPRKDRSPLFFIYFSSSEKISKFNLDAFESGKLSVASLPSVIAERFRAWKTESERIDAEREAEAKAARVEAEESAKLALEYRRDFESRVAPFFSYMADVSPHASALEYIEKSEAARLQHYRKSLPTRIEWLKSWALKISQGEIGLDPMWSNGQAAATYLKAQNIAHLWHFTDIRNLPHIFYSGGLLSYLALEALVSENVQVWLSSNDESIRRDRSLGRQDSVRLSFVPNSFFFQRANRNACLVWLRFSPAALSLGDISYCRGNAASEFASMYSRPEALGLDWNLLKSFSGCQMENGPPLSYPAHYASEWDAPEDTRLKSITLNSEILVEHFLPLDFCTGIFDIQNRAWIPFSRK